MSLDAMLRQEIVNFLIELDSFHGEDGRKAILLTAGLDKLIPKTTLQGKTSEVVPLLVESLSQYGTVPDQQQPALICLLQAVKAQVGLDKQAILQGFCDRLTQQQNILAVCPYRGLSAFREEDEPFFFGREIFIEKLVDAVITTPIVSVIGPSGSGKSSVVFAGLVPHLRRQSQKAPTNCQRSSNLQWIITSFTPGVNPFQSLAEALSYALKQLQSIQQTGETASFQRKDDIHDLISSMIDTQNISLRVFGIIKQRIEQLRHGEPVLGEILKLFETQHLSQQYRLGLFIVADQFEELYTLCGDKELREQFLSDLFDRLNQSSEEAKFIVRLVITLRADFLGKVLADPFLSTILTDSSDETTRSTKLFLSTMTYRDLKAVIEKPVKKSGIDLEEGLTERILDAIAKEPGNLPLLEFTLTLLWHSRTDNVLTTATYERIGGVEQALACYADKWYNTLMPEEQKRTRQIFIQLVRPGEGTEDTRRNATRNELGEENWNFVTTKLAHSRLVITAKIETPEEIVTLIHEALIREWQCLRDWLKMEREFRIWQEYLRTARRQWERSGHYEGALLQGPLLKEAREWLEKKEGELGYLEREYIKTSEEFVLQEQEKAVNNEYELQNLTDELLDKYSEITLIYNLSEELNAVFDPTTVCDIIINTIVSVIGVERASLMLYDEHQNALYIMSSYGLGLSAEEIAAIRIAPGESVSGRVFQTGEPIASDGIEDWTLLDLSLKKEGMYKKKSFLCIPISFNSINTEQHVMGVINMADKQTSDMFTAGDKRLLSTIASQAAMSLHIIQRIERVKDTERMRREMEIAQQIQSGLLPREPPHIIGLDMAGLCLPATQVGGDYYDFFRHSEHELGLVIADVSGHDVGSTFILSTFRSALRSGIFARKSPSHILKDTNLVLYEDLTGTEKFITMFYAEYDGRTRMLQYSNAAQNPPILLRGGVCTMLDTEGFFIGMWESAEFQEKTLQLVLNDFIIFYTDGVIEAKNSSGQMFTLQRLTQVIETTLSHMNASNLLQIIHNKLDDFMRKVPPMDDITVVVLKVCEPE